MVKLKRLNVFSVAKTTAFIGGISGLIFLIITLISKYLVLLFFSRMGLNLSFGSSIFLFLLPIIYFILGFIGGAIYAIIYNFAAKLTGGIEMEFQ